MFTTQMVGIDIQSLSAEMSFSVPMSLCETFLHDQC